MKPPLKNLIACTVAITCISAPIHISPITAAPAPQQAGTTAGWNQFWSNQTAAARASFRAALKARPSDTAARRALGWLALQEGDNTAAVAAWLPLFTSAPGQPETAMLWTRFAAICETTGSYAALSKAAHAVMASKTASPAFKQAARVTQAGELSVAGKTAAAAALLAGDGGIVRWRAVGPFDNVSRSGFNKVYEPERNLNAAKTYVAKDELTVGWHSIGNRRSGGHNAILLASSLGDGGPCVFYAATAIYAPRAGQATLFFDANGASKLFVNGRTILADEVDRSAVPYGAEPFMLKTALHSGWNTVLVKMADGATSAALFSLRVFGPDGKPLLADPAKAGAVSGVPVSANQTEPVFQTADNLAALAIAKQPLTATSAEKLMMLAYNQMAANDHEAADVSYKSLLRKFPNSGWLRYESSKALSADGQEDAAKVEREKALSLQRGLLDAHLDRLDAEDDSLTASQKINRLRALLKNHPRSSRLYWNLASAYSEANMGTEMIKAARTAAVLAPSGSSMDTLATYYSVDDRTNEQIAALQKGLKDFPNDVVLLTSLAEVWEEQGKTKQALAAYQRALISSYSPASIQMSIADLQLALNDRAGAISTLRAVRAARPQSAMVASKLATFLQQSGQKAAAIAMLKEAVRLKPTETSLRDRLQLWSGEKPVLDLVPATAPGAIIAKGAKLAAKDGAPVIVLLDEGRQAVYPDYTTVARYHFIAKVFDAAGVARFTQFPLNKASSEDTITVESARLIKADGTVQEGEESTDEDKVLFPSLAPGDIIDVSHRVESRQSGSLARSFWLNWNFSIQRMPVLQSRFVLVTPAAMTFATQERGSVPAMRQRTAGAWSVREWAARDISATQAQLAGPPSNEWQSGIDISSVPSWTKISSWYRDISGPLTVADATVRAKALELTRDAKTENDKLRAIIRFVSSIQYQSTPFRLSAFVPTPGKQVLRDRYADCKDKAALLTALLGAVGIRSDMVLLSSRDAGIQPYLPSPRFNHAIARVMTANGELWVDATADQLEFGNLPQGDQGVPALIINGDTTGLTTSPVLPTEKDSSEELTRATLNAYGKLEGDFSLSARGNPGSMLRTLTGEVAESDRTEILKVAITKLVPKARYRSGAWTGLNDIEKSIGFDVNFVADGYASKAGAFLLTSMPWSVSTTDIDSLRAGGKRSLAIETSSWRGFVHRAVEMKLPAGYEPQDLPSETAKDSRWGTYRFTYEVKEGVLHAHSTLSSTALRVESADTKEYLDWMDSYNTELARQIVLKKP